jgi:hypothetical protein
MTESHFFGTTHDPEAEAHSDHGETHTESTEHHEDQDHYEDHNQPTEAKENVMKENLKNVAGWLLAVTITLFLTTGDGKAFTNQTQISANTTLTTDFTADTSAQFLTQTTTGFFTGSPSAGTMTNLTAVESFITSDGTFTEADKSSQFSKTSTFQNTTFKSGGETSDFAITTLYAGASFTNDAKFTTTDSPFNTGTVTFTNLTDAFDF